MKEKFEDVAVIQKPVKGLFEVADKKFKKDAKYRNNAEVTDEIWFFFDVDDGQTGSWDRIQKIVSTLKKLRKKPNIRVRLLMTTGCVEFWFLLHYKKVVPSIQTVAEKENVLRLLQNECPGYVKGDSNTTRKIADHFKQASINGDWVLGQIEGLPTLEDSDVRNRWLYQSSRIFTTGARSIKFLENLKFKKVVKNISCRFYYIEEKFFSIAECKGVFMLLEKMLSRKFVCVQIEKC